MEEQPTLQQNIEEQFKFVPFYSGPKPDEEYNKFIPFHGDPEDKYKPLPMDQAKALYEQEASQTPYGQLKMEGKTDDEIEAQLEPIVTDMLKEGYSPEAVYQAIGHEKFKNTDKKMANKIQFEIGRDVAAAQALSTSIGRDLRSLVDSDYDEQYKQDKIQKLQYAAQNLVGRGIIDSFDLEKNKAYKDGEEYELDSSFLQNLVNAKWEVGLGIGAGLLSRNPLVGSLAAAEGRIRDVISASEQIGYEITPDDIQNNALIALAEDAGLVVAFQGMYKLGKSGIKYANDFFQDITADYVNGAYRDFTRLYGDEDAMIAKTKQYLKTFDGGDAIIAKGPDSIEFKQAAMEAISVTDSRFVAFVNAASRSKDSNMALARHLESRRSKLMASIERHGPLIRGKNIADAVLEAKDEAGKLYGESQGALVKGFEGVKIDIGDLKQEVSGAVDILSSDPKFVTRITDREEKGLKLLKDYLTKTDDMTTLLNVRETYNDILTKLGLHRKKVKGPIAERLLNVKDKIDDLIDTSVSNNNLLTDAEKDFFKESFNQSKNLLHETYKAVDSQLYKNITAPGKESDKIIDDFIKYAKSDDGEFEQVVSTLNLDTRRQLEISMVERAARQSSDKAVNFETLGDTISKIKPRLRTQEAQKVVQGIEEFQKLFKNEQSLWRFVESFKMPSSGAGMSDNPMSKFTFQYVRSAYEDAQPALAAMLDRIVLLRNVPGVRAIIESGITQAQYKNIEKSLRGSKTVKDFATELLQNDTGLTPEAATSIRDFIRMYSKIHDEYNKVQPAVRTEMERRAAEASMKANLDDALEIETYSRQRARDAIDVDVIHKLNPPKGQTLYASQTGQIDPNIHAITRILRDAERVKDQAIKMAGTDDQTIQQAYDLFKTRINESKELTRNEFNLAWNDYIETINNVRGRSIGLMPTTRMKKLEMPEQTTDIESVTKNPQVRQMLEWHIGDNHQEREALTRLDAILPKIKGNYSGTAYRGITSTALDDLKPGEYFSADTRMSFSTSRKVAEDEFAEGAGKKTIFIVDSFPADRKPIRLKEFFPENVLAQHEDEVLVSPETVFRIKKKTEKGGNVIFHIEQVNEVDEGKRFIKSSKVGGKYAQKEMH